ncbi:MAG: TIGR00730 family Rossman fold protein [Rhizomicrobium sp.]
MKQKPAICVFCGSSDGNNPHFSQSAEQFGQFIGSNGFSLIYGGGGAGMMGTLARATAAAGGDILGIMPDFLRSYELPPEWVHDLVLTSDMAQRKNQMIDAAAAFVILPGGPGTMDEFFEVMTLKGLNRIHQPILLVDVDGYFAPLNALVAHMQAAGLMRDGYKDVYETVASPAEAMARLQQLLG